MKLIVTKWKEKVDSDYVADGLIRLNTAKPEFGSLMLTAHQIVVTNGFVNNRKKIGFITGVVEELESIITTYNVVEGSDFSALVAPHRIVILEKVESEIKGEFGYSEKINPKSGQILAKDGEPIYRKTEVVEEGSDIKDTLITHDRIAVDAPDNAVQEFENAGKEHVLKEL